MSVDHGFCRLIGIRRSIGECRHSLYSGGRDLHKMAWRDEKTLDIGFRHWLVIEVCQPTEMVDVSRFVNLRQ